MEDLLATASQILSGAVGLDPRRTVSSQAGEAAERGEFWAMNICNALDLLDPGHCEVALATDPYAYEPLPGDGGGGGYAPIGKPPVPVGGTGTNEDPYQWPEIVTTASRDAHGLPCMCSAEMEKEAIKQWLRENKCCNRC